MRILYITNKPMFPLSDGGSVASWTWLKNMLHLGFGVKYLTIETDKHPYEPEEFPKELIQIVSPRVEYVDTVIRAKDAFLSFFSSKSYNIERFYSPAFEQAVAEELRSAEYGLVMLENAYVLPYVPVIRKHFKGKIMIRTHNVEYRIWERLAQDEKSFLKRIFMKKLAKDLKNYEINHLPLTDGIAAISEDDVRLFRQMGIKIPVRSIPVSMELAASGFDYSQSPANHDFFFLGAMNWQPNIESVDFLLEEVFPKILALQPEAKLHLAGSYMPDKLVNLKQPGVVVHGRVDDIRQFMTTHGILLVPMKSGSGIRIKILEALAFGIPVVSTSVGFEGIPVQHGVHGLLADTAEEIAACAVELSNDRNRAAQLGKNGQHMVLETFSQENVSQKLLEFIGSI